jgi:hypothetical protein
MDGFTLMASQPGQLSLAIDKLKGNHDLARKFQAGLAVIRGINRVEANPDQGLVEVSYDKRQITSLDVVISSESHFFHLFPRS